MDKYYYLISQLPFLNFETEPAVTRRYFIDEAKKWLSEDDFSSLEQIDISQYEVITDTKSEILKNYSLFEFELRAELKEWRKAKKEGHEHKPYFFSSALLKDDDPLQVETKLLQLRWDYVSIHEPGHNFDLDAVIAYYIKLQILERLNTFNKEEGNIKFQDLSSLEKVNEA